MGVPGDPRTYYAATASGGVWKSINGGLSWSPIFDDQPISSIGSIAVAPSSSSGVGRRGKDDAQSETVGGTKDAGKERTLITTALRTLERDMALLDDVASLQTQLSSTEVGLLLGAIAASGVGPIFFPGTSVTEVLAPAAAACEWRIFFFRISYVVFRSISSLDARTMHEIICSLFLSSFRSLRNHRSYRGDHHRIGIHREGRGRRWERVCFIINAHTPFLACFMFLQCQIRDEQTIVVNLPSRPTYRE